MGWNWRERQNEMKVDRAMRQANDTVGALSAEIRRLRGEAATSMSSLAEKDQEIGRLTSLLSERDAEIEKLNSALGKLSPKGTWLCEVLENIWRSTSREEACTIGESAQLQIEKSGIWDRPTNIITAKAEGYREAAEIAFNRLIQGYGLAGEASEIRSTILSAIPNHIVDKNEKVKGVAITGERLAAALAKFGVVQAAAVDDPEDYDEGKTADAIYAAAVYLSIPNHKQGVIK